MVHFKAEEHDGGDLTSTYVHSPSDLPTSIQDYLEDMWSQGWELVSTFPRGGDSTWMWVFKANGQ